MQGVSNRNLSTKHLVKGMLLMRDVSLTKLADELNRNFGYSFTQSNLSRKLNTEKSDPLRAVKGRGLAGASCGITAIP